MGYVECGNKVSGFIKCGRGISYYPNCLLLEEDPL